MAILSGLPGTSEDKEATIVQSVSGVLRALASGKTPTAAGDNGAINVWVDDEGKFRCEFMRWRSTVDAQVFQFKKQVAAWLKVWFPQMQR